MVFYRHSSGIQDSVPIGFSAVVRGMKTSEAIESSWSSEKSCCRAAFLIIFSAYLDPSELSFSAQCGSNVEPKSKELGIRAGTSTERERDYEEIMSLMQLKKLHHFIKDESLPLKLHPMHCSARMPYFCEHELRSSFSERSICKSSLTLTSLLRILVSFHSLCEFRVGGELNEHILRVKWHKSNFKFEEVQYFSLIYRNLLYN